MPTSRASKYGAVKETVDGHTFPSKREAKRYRELKLLERAGQIRGLELQPKFEVIINGKSCFSYLADFRYAEGGQCVVEDCKGMRTPLYRLKKKVVEAMYGITIVET